MITETKIKEIIRNTLITYCNENSYEYALPNYSFEGEISNPIIGFYFMSFNFTDIFLNRTKRLNGMFQINISTPIGSGTYLSDKIKDELVSLFDIGIVLKYDTSQVHITNIYGSGNVTSDIMYTETLTVEYSEFTSRE